MHANQQQNMKVQHDADGVVNNIFDMAQAPPMDASEKSAAIEFDRIVATARRWPRSMSTFFARVRDQALVSQGMAESCFYALPRGGKTLIGPSIRLAEIAARSFGNMDVSTRIVDEDDSFIYAEASAIDYETNFRVRVIEPRRILNKDNRRFNIDMIGVTGKAAMSIARRNAIFQIVPRAMVDEIVEVCREYACGKSIPLDQRRSKAIDYWAKFGVDAAEMCALIGCAGIDDIGFDQIAALTGLATAIKQGDTSIDAERERLRQEKEDAEGVSTDAASSLSEALSAKSKRDAKK